MPASNGGFLKMPHWVIRQSDLDGNELLVYMAIANHADQRGSAHPSIATIALEARMSERTVKRTLSKLVDRGILSVTVRPRVGAKNDPNLYRVERFADQSPDPAARSIRIGAHHAPQWGAESPRQGRTTHPEVEPLEEEPVGEERDPHNEVARVNAGVFDLRGKRRLTLASFITAVQDGGLDELTTVAGANVIAHLGSGAFSVAEGREQMRLWASAAARAANGGTGDVKDTFVLGAIDAAREWAANCPLHPGYPRPCASCAREAA